MFSKALLGLFLCLYAVAATAAPTPVESFFSYAKISDAKVSPDGKYLALVVPDPKTGEDRKGLVLVTADDTHKLTGSFSVTGYEVIANYWWLADDRILAATATQAGSFDIPKLNGHLYAINPDGTHQASLMPEPEGNGGKFVGGTAHNGEMVYFFGLLHIDEQDAKHVLIYGGTYGLNGHYNQVNQVYSLDVYSGALRRVLSSPLQNGFLETDDTGEVRVVVGEDPKDGSAQALYRVSDEKSDWKDLTSLYEHDDPAETYIGPAGVEPDDKHLYWFGRTSTSTIGLYSLDPDTLKMTELASDPALDISDLVWSMDWHGPKHVIAVETMPGLPAVNMLDGDDPKAQVLASLYDAFPGQHVTITSNTRDGNQMVVFVSSDRNPGEYYLFDAKDNKVSYLFSSKPEIDATKMAFMRPIVFQARDGLTLHGYLTLPPGSDGKNLPLIINPHGGPYQIRDEWRWDPEAQFFASRGYAFLQVNYRGSAGYGMKFTDAGYRQWGGVMQDDLADAVRWAIKQGTADPRRVCIYGGSYGGYAAIENPIRYPDLYRCAVGYAGPYDLTLAAGHGDTHHFYSGARYLSVVLGDDEQQLKAYSPVFNADKLKAALFIVYGGQDMRVVPQNSEELMAALDKLGKKYKKLYKAEEFHGFYKPDNRIELYTQMLQFFDENIGSGATTPQPPAKP